MTPPNGRSRPGGGGLRSISSGSSYDKVKVLPTDFEVTLSDHGHEFLVEIRENGRLICRRTLTHDAVTVDHEFAYLLHGFLQRRWEQARGEVR